MTSDARSTLGRWKRLAERAGWRVDQGGGGHWKWFAPDGRTIIVTPATPGQGRAIRNVRADLRRAGLDV
jgi:hypothetical protein